MGTDGSSAFEEHRDHLMAVAYRTLGSRADAEDAVQEAWLRWHRADRDQIRDPRAWLTTVTARICLDHLRSARVRRESYVGQWLPEPIVDSADPADHVAQIDEVGYALLVVLERLSPEQRVAFVLHDAFAVPYDEIAAVLSTTPDAARQLASRARRAVSSGGVPRHTADHAEQRRVLDAFLAAVTSGDLDGLLKVLAPDVVSLADGGGVVPAARRPVTGALPVARLLRGLSRIYLRRATRFDVTPVLVNGDPGMFFELELPDGTVWRGTTAFTVDSGRITGLFNQLNPTKLGQASQAGQAPASSWARNRR